MRCIRGLMPVKRVLDRVQDVLYTAGTSTIHLSGIRLRITREHWRSYELFLICEHRLANWLSATDSCIRIAWPTGSSFFSHAPFHPNSLTMTGSDLDRIPSVSVSLQMKGLERSSTTKESVSMCARHAPLTALFSHMLKERGLQ